MSSTITCATVFKDGRGSKRTVVRVTIIDHDVVSGDTGVRTIVMGYVAVRTDVQVTGMWAYGRWFTVGH